jgi:glutamate-1-semialdehyde 2,1-aminomutase
MIKNSTGIDNMVQKTHNSGQELWKKAKKIIPGGTQLLSKRSELFLPDYWPSYYSRAKGVDIWDIDNNKLLDMTFMGVGACPLGYADDDVDAAVKTAIDNGSMCSLNCPEDVELAEKLMNIHPWAEKVRYARGGGDAMAVAVRIARAHTKRDKIAFCGYHGWHDWYLAANLDNDRNLDGHHIPGLNPAGVPRGLIGTSIPFNYNHPEELESIAENNNGELAAIVMEPLRDHAPEPEFIKTIHRVARESGAVYIIDEVSAGFRLITGGAHKVYNLKPDIAVFAKAISNGYPMGAIIGISEVMESAQDSFISSTYWTERLGPVAACATIEKYQRCNVPEHLIRTGNRVQDIWRKAGASAGLDVEAGGIPPLSHVGMKGVTPEMNQTIFTLYTQLMLDRGILAGKSFYPSLSHKQKHLDLFEAAVEECFGIISKAVDTKSIDKMIKGPVAQSGFKRLT